MNELPTSADGARHATIDIPSAGTYRLRTYYRHRGACFLLDVYEASGEPVLLGVPLVAGVSLLHKAPRTRARLGQLRMSMDSASPASLGDMARLVQFDPGEFEGLAPPPAVALAPITADTALFFSRFKA